MTQAAVADAVEVVLGLRIEQLDTLERRFARMSAEFTRQRVEVGPERAREDMYRHALKTLERWYGAFDDGARTRLRRLADEIPLDTRLELEDMRRRQRELLAFLRAVSAGKLTAQRELQHYIDEIAALAPPRSASREGATPEPYGRSLEQSGPPKRP